MPLFDRGELRAEERAARVLIAQQEANLKEIERLIISEVSQKQTLFTTARQVADTYAREIVPKTVHLRTVVRNLNNLLKPNMFVRVMVSRGSGELLMVPDEAV